MTSRTLSTAAPRFEPYRRPRFWSLPPVAFFTALAAAPLAMALIGAALLPVAGVGFIVLVSIPLGAPSYLLVGGPLFWLTVLDGRRSAFPFVVAGFMANLIAAPLMLIALLPTAGSFEDAYGPALFVHGFGVLFAPLYGLLFGLVFGKLVDPTALRPPLPTLDELLAAKEARDAHARV